MCQNKKDSLMRTIIENNPVMTLFTYSIVLITATWAVSRFMLFERTLDYYKAQIETQKSIVNQFEAKLKIFEIENANLKRDNDRYLSWLQDTEKTFPFAEKRINALEKKNEEYKIAIAEYSTSKSVVISNPFVPPKEIAYTFKSGDVKIGNAVIDPHTKASVGIESISSNWTAQGVVSLPGQNIGKVSTLSPGQVFDFQYDKKNFKLIMSKIDWYTNTYSFDVIEIK